MGFWSFVALAVVCFCLMEAYRTYVKYKSKTAHSGEVAELEARIAALEGDESLEQRVRTLEAIVTDPKYQLDRDIDQLRK